MRLRPALFVVGLTVVPATLWIILGLGRFGEKATVEQMTEHFAPRIEEWNDQSFSAIEPTPTFRGSIDPAVRITPSSHGLSTAQVRGIGSSLYAALLAYNEGTFEAFRRFRVPGLEFELDPGLANYLRSESDKDGSHLPSKPLEQLEFYWKHHIKQRFVGLWKEVALGSATVEIQRATSEIPDLHDYISKHVNAGSASGGPILVLPVNPVEILKRAGEVVYATASAIVRSEESTYPVYWRYVWDAESDQWVLMDMKIAYSGPRKETPIF